jgi:hypothetical protein
MSDELTPDLREIDALLRRAAPAFAYPPTPAIAEAVTARLRAEAVDGPSGWRTTLGRWSQRPIARPALAVASAAVVVVAVALAVPTSRTAIAEFFGLRNVRVEVVPTATAPVPTAVPASFARPATLAGAEKAAIFPLRFPTRDGVRLQPDGVYLYGTGADSIVIFVYEEEPFDLYQSQDALLGKGVSDPGDYEEFQFDGHNAVWFPPGDHLASFLDPRGTPIAVTERTVERATLLWEVDSITYRLETTLSRDEAIAVAESLQ